MNFRDKKGIPPKYIYLFLAIICFILLFLSVVFENQFYALKRVTSTVIVPMQTGINDIGSSIYQSVSEKKSKQELMEENKKLTAKLDEYSAQLKAYEQNSYELKRLQELVDMKEQYEQYHTTAARVIATDSTNWFHMFVIDKGKKDGVQVGCNVLAQGGLAGIVTEVGDDYAKVRAIIDDNSNVSAAIASTDILCTISGDLTSIKNGYIDVKYMNKASEVDDHAELVTSHISKKFLPGILIGYITDLEVDSNNLTKSAKCIPVVDFSNLQEVLVVLDLKATYKTKSENKNTFDSITDGETDKIEGKNSTEENLPSGGEEEEDNNQSSSEDEILPNIEDTDNIENVDNQDQE